MGASGSGVTGFSVDALLGDLYGQHATNKDRINMNLENTTDQLAAERDALGTNYTRTVASLPSVQKPRALGYAAERKRAIVDEYNNNFDKDNGDIDAFLAQYAENDFAAYGDNPFIMSGYREGMGGLFNAVKNQHSEYQSGLVKEQTGTNFVSVTRGAIDTAIASGGDIMPHVRAIYTDHKKALGLTYAEMDDHVMMVAAEYAAAGDFATVEAILNYEAVGDDGTKVGSFSQRPKYSEKAAQLLETAKANQGKHLREANTATMVDLSVAASVGGLSPEQIVQLDTLKKSEQISQREHEGLLEQNRKALKRQTAEAWSDNIKLEAGNEALKMVLEGRAWQIMDQEVVNPHTGDTISITREELVQKNAEHIMMTLEGKGSTPAVMAQQLGAMGIDYKYPKWQAAMTFGHIAITDALASVDANGQVELPERATVGYDLYKGLSDNPQVRGRHVSDEAEAIYRDAELLESLGWEPNEALLKSATIDRKGGRKSLSSSVERGEFYTAVKGLVKRRGFLGFGENVANGQRVSQDIEHMVRVQMDLGVPMEKAIDNSVELWEQSHTVINGAAINTRDIWVPGNMDEASTAYLTAFAAASGDDVDELTLMPTFDGSNYWVVAYKGNVAHSADGTKELPNRIHITQIQQAAVDALESAGPSLDDVNSTIQKRSDFIAEQEANPPEQTKVTISPDISANPLLAPINRGEDR
ncbi:hypothetical protein [Ruegeria sp. Ofav3-42]|uniref:virion core protein, T7 gp14 family n=1 Tax=Ruegeria sp. Ofav3-42 TaxID=2917759 RepID=UPI001EF464CC|nr:hypothetical protein [Ruegeria sp. Ofav3-42]MCG7520503.1 hypothetical protein [Ruegeria sp. Ofav3-42]